MILLFTSVADANAAADGVCDTSFVRMSALADAGADSDDPDDDGKDDMLCTLTSAALLSKSEMSAGGLCPWPSLSVRASSHTFVCSRKSRRRQRAFRAPSSHRKKLAIEMSYTRAQLHTVGPLGHAVSVTPAYW